MAGAPLPWIKATVPFAGTITKSGMEGGDGWIFIGLGAMVLLVGLLLLTGESRRGASFVLIASALAGGALLLWEFNDISDRFTAANADVEATAGAGAGLFLVTEHGIGLYVMSAGALLTLVAWMQLLRSD